MFPISQGWAKGNFITKVTIRENMKKAKEQKEEYKRLTRDFEVK